MSRLRTSSKPCEWVTPRPYTDAGLRLHHYGPIQPMPSNRYREAGISPRRELAFTAVALVLLAVGVLGWSVVL